MRARCLAIAILALVLAAPVFAGGSTVFNGIDAWHTPGDGQTFIDFSKTPIPADFFCPGSAPLTSLVALEGEPVAIGGQSQPGRVDTIVQRLDDAVFDRSGIAVTRLQVRAMQLRGVSPISTSCGRFDLRVGLEGTQPVTQMTIRRESANGGSFLAPLSLNTKVTFVALDNAEAKPLTLSLPVRFPATPIPWRSLDEKLHVGGLLLVDTNGDKALDTYLPGRSNFLAGGDPVHAIYRPSCHTDPATGEQHCPEPEPMCGNYPC